ncbi:type IV pilus twitching motility protein PilT [Proteus myxofaciens]|uniref:PilT family twitching motility protein n=1 Tax=Proteus myxofaciens ATCC 19692 TaxID=1354337 RepID=A0A198FJE2_9GAMM|nr:PilT/PilU family type 4a pilus ATPase [Proteus myxofaciens]OAT24885.1 PilT family twitching motility protein [Proteus myxofaciens ATCC 19692]
MNMENLITYSVKHNASDLHLCCGEVPRLRINGILYQQNQCKPITSERLLAWFIPFLNDIEKQQFEENSQIDTAITLCDGQRLRVNLFCQYKGISAVIRIISQQIPTLASLRISESVSELLENYSHGLIVITGTTGSGKSSTLAAMINHLNQYTRQHILTFEDPIEFIHQNKQSMIQQREIGRDVKSIDYAIKSALRQDPDVIVFGELRDRQSIEMALIAAETGHLVLATLHTKGAVQTLERMTNTFATNEKQWVSSQLAGSLRAIISQELIPAINKGRIAIFEIMLVTQGIAHLIRESKYHQVSTLIQTGSEYGMQTFMQSRQQRQHEGLISK